MFMAQFKVKAKPDENKLRGGFYTPDAVAEYITKWVMGKPGSYLEPSCGDGAILNFMANKKGYEVTAIELDGGEAKKASEKTQSLVLNLDFFDWLTPEKYGTFDGVVGNPPYIRFGNWAEVSRSKAMTVLEREGIKPNRLTNAWLPFVVSSLLAVKNAGKVALVVPAELLQVSYAASLRSYLIDNCSNITIISFRELIFPGIQQEVIILMLTKGSGPADIQTFEVASAAELSQIDLVSKTSIRGELHDGEKWTKYYLDSSSIKILRNLRTSGLFAKFGDYAEVQVGVVTGCNDFFCLSKSDADNLDLTKYTIPIVTRSNQLSGLGINKDLFQELESNSGRSRLLDLNGYTFSDLPPSVVEYIRSGEKEDLHKGYKCSIRTDWWKVPSIWIPDGFMLRQIYKYPRIFVNEANATCTDTVHRIRITGKFSVKALSVVSLNSATLTWGELLGRSYGGGVLELEPSEARSLPIPDPKFASTTLIKRVSAHLENGETDQAINLVDTEILMNGLGITKATIKRLNKDWLTLANRRLDRK